MKYKILWDTNYRHAGHRGSPADPRPTEIEADTFFIIYSGVEGSQFPSGLQFKKGYVNILTIFNLPISVTAVEEDIAEVS